MIRSSESIRVSWCLLEKLDLSLIMLMLTSISILDGILAIIGGYKIVAKVKRCIFANSFMSTTMQDGGKCYKTRVWTDLD